MRYLLLVLGLSLFVLEGCSVKKSISMYETRQPYYGNITIVPMGQQVPEGYKMIGTASYGEGGFTKTSNCTLEAIIDQARQDASKNGASLVNIMKVKEPNVWGSSCYYVTVAFYIEEIK